MSADVIDLAAHIRRRACSGHGLSDQDCFLIAAALRLLPGYWLAQRDEEPDGVVRMTLFASEVDAAPVFVVRRDAGMYCLERGRSAHPAGRFGNVRDMMQAARRALDN